jgi:hypothetical protein
MSPGFLFRRHDLGCDCVNRTHVNVDSRAAILTGASAHSCNARLCCTDRLVSALSPPHGFRLGDADGLRASELKHAIEGMNGDGDLGRAAGFSPRAQRMADHSFEAADGGLHQSPTRVPGCLLPTYASMLGDALEVPIALGRSALCRLARYRSRSWWHDHFRIRIALSDGAVDASLIIGSISDEGGEWAYDLVEQRLDLRAIIDIMGRQL